MQRTHNNSELRLSDIGKAVSLCGWVNKRRDLGGVIFIDLRDRYGITQTVTDPEQYPMAHQTASNVRSEYIVKVKGIVRARPEGQTNKNIETGEIEVIITECNVLNESLTPPFEIDQDSNVNEEIRLKYRYLDLRRKRMRDNIIFRHKVVKMMRDMLDAQDFLEIETPILIKGTPEGSREYIVPSRIYSGNFFVLPQSPQQLKQLLMVAGFDKYFQFARCFRDEDLRGDRQPEFTQLDMEMSFADEEDIIEIMENMLVEVSEKLVPEKNILMKPFPRITWQEAMENYGSDKPDIRFEMKIVDVTEIAGKTEFKVFKDAVANGGVVKCLRVPGGLEITRKEIDQYTKLARNYGLNGLGYIQITSDGPKSSLVKFFNEKELKKFLDISFGKSGDLLFFGAGEFESVCNALGQIRLACGDKFGLHDNKKLAYVWVTDFPLFERDKETEGLNAAHHPFTAPRDDQFENLEKNPEKTIAKAYDIILNGYELGGGSVRIHNRNLQSKIFELLKISPEEAKKRFGHMLEAFEYGAPPHCGIAIGIERLLMNFRDEPNIREVMAFPKDSRAKDLMLGAPSYLPKETIEDLGLEIKQQTQINAGNNN